MTASGRYLSVSDAGYAHLQQHPEDWKTISAVAGSFREFLNYWHFRDTETGEVRVLGHCLWEAQEEFIRATDLHEWLFTLKARKLGESTIEQAYDGWVARWRQRNGRVHLFSRRGEAANDLLKEIKFGLERQPEYMRLPFGTDNSTELELIASPDGSDKRIIKAYPADEDTAVEGTCIHGHVDEWARMRNPRRVWQAIEPSMAGTCHIITTGMGPQNYSSHFWRKCMAGDVKKRGTTTMAAVFIGALARPDRDEAWLRAQRASMDELEFRREYALSWQDALFGGGEFVFTPEEIDAAGVDFRGILPAQKGRKYVKAWDIGRHKDAAVGTVLDVTEDVHDVVGYVRLRGVNYPGIQKEIEIMHREYPGITAVEKNSAGEAVLENLDLPEHELEGFTTSKPSKARIIQQLKVALQSQLLKWDPLACHQLDSEVRGYQTPDESVVQDSVISLAIAEEYAPMAQAQGRVGRIAQI